MNFLQAYAHYLFRREAAILMTFRRQGRTRRILLPAYWRSTLLPLAVPAGFGFLFLMGYPSSMALAAGFALLAGLLFGEFMLYRQSQMAWPVFERVLQWDRLAQYHQAQIGRLPAVSREKSDAGPAGGANGGAGNGAGRQVPTQMRKMILNGYVAARRNPPGFDSWITRAPEVRVMAILMGIIVVMQATGVLAEPSGLWLLGPMFFLGLQGRRAKMGIDFILTWPLMEQFIDWQAVYRDADTVEEVQF